MQKQVFAKISSVWMTPITHRDIFVGESSLDRVYKDVLMSILIGYIESRRTCPEFRRVIDQWQLPGVEVTARLGTQQNSHNLEIKMHHSADTSEDPLADGWMPRGNLYHLM